MGEEEGEFKKRFSEQIYNKVSGRCSKRKTLALFDEAKKEFPVYNSIMHPIEPAVELGILYDKLRRQKQWFVRWFGEAEQK